VSTQATFNIKMRIDISDNLHARIKKMTAEELEKFVLVNAFRNNSREILKLNSDIRSER
jgi:hypothetical protein